MNIDLNGCWAFAYSKGMCGDNKPAAQEFSVEMPVPGYWDDNIDKLREASFWDSVEFNPDYKPVEFPMGENPVDASLAFIVGVGWYRKTLDIPSGWESKIVTLAIGGVRLEAWVWLNRELICHHLGHSTPFKAVLSGKLKPGESNELVIAVSNTRTDRSGCALRGYQGRSGGIYGDVHLKVADMCGIEDCYVFQQGDANALQWNVELSGNPKRGVVLEWKISDPADCETIDSGSVPVSASKLSWHTNVLGLKPWSDREPNLYQIELILRHGDEILDHHTQSFGLRTIYPDSTNIHLNGHPVYLRGVTDHCYFPITCTPPSDFDYYCDIIGKLKRIGFNWIRCHTWVPTEEYMLAADKMGMLMQVEPPVGFEEQEWVDILRACRKHPSVALYCCGNEELLDEAKIDQLRKMSVRCRELVPDALFNPQEALRGVEYVWNDTDLGNEVTYQPYPHNPRRLSLLKEFSDVFGQYSWGLLSYGSKDGDWRTIDERLAEYELPCLSHEIGIHSSYLDLSLEDRYVETRIGTDLFSTAREYLETHGLSDKSDVYYRNSCAWMRSLRKHNVETARKCRLISGYDFLGATDHHWHRTGYPGGIMNEFYELKPGESESDVRKYNNESVLLLDHTNQRNLTVGSAVEMDVMVSLYGEFGLQEGVLRWSLADACGRIYIQGEWNVIGIRNGVVETLGTIKFAAPDINEPCRVNLFVTLIGDGYNIDNNWDFWVFPEASCAPAKDLRIVNDLDDRTLELLNDGGRVVLLGRGPFPAMPTSFQMACAGRSYGNLATVIYGHPLMNDFPHDGYCDWQFHSMLEGGCAVVFNDLDAPFDPVIEVVSSYKSILKQSNLFEFRVGKGRLMVCAMNMDASDPGASYLLSKIIAYCDGEEFNPAHQMQVSQLAELTKREREDLQPIGTDRAFDPNAQKLSASKEVHGLRK